MSALVYCTIALVALIAPISATRACCYPQQMQGVKDTIETRKSNYFAADYVRGYLFETENLSGDRHKIYDLHRNVIYSISGETCSSRSLTMPGLFNPCFETDDKVKTNATMGGDANTIRVNTFEFQVGRLPVFRAVTSEGCMPVVAQTQIGRRSLTSVYYNVQSTISDPAVFSHLSKCSVPQDRRETDNEGEEGEDEENEERRHESEEDSSEEDE